MIRSTSSTFFFLLLFLLLRQSSSSPAAAMEAAATHHHHHHHPNIINETCKHSASGDSNVNYTFCLQAFNSVPKSKHADLRGLAIISLKLAKASAKHAKSTAKTLLKDKQQLSAYEKSCLETCRELYAGAASSLRDSVKMVKQGRHGDANVYISSAVDAPGECEDGFQEGGLTFPLKRENYGLFQLAVIALSITSRLG